MQLFYTFVILFLQISTQSDFTKQLLFIKSPTKSNNVYEIILFNSTQIVLEKDKFFCFHIKELNVLPMVYYSDPTLENAQIQRWHNSVLTTFPVESKYSSKQKILCEPYCYNISTIAHSKRWLKVKTSDANTIEEITLHDNEFLFEKIEDPVLFDFFDKMEFEELSETEKLSKEILFQIKETILSKLFFIMPFSVNSGVPLENLSSVPFLFDREYFLLPVELPTTNSNKLVRQKELELNRFLVLLYETEHTGNNYVLKLNDLKAKEEFHNFLALLEEKVKDNAEPLLSFAWNRLQITLEDELSTQSVKDLDALVPKVLKEYVLEELKNEFKDFADFHFKVLAFYLDKNLNTLVEKNLLNKIVEIFDGLKVTIESLINTAVQVEEMKQGVEEIKLSEVDEMLSKLIENVTVLKKKTATSEEGTLKEQIVRVSEKPVWKNYIDEKIERVRNDINVLKQKSSGGHNSSLRVKETDSKDNQRLETLSAKPEMSGKTKDFAVFVSLCFMMLILLILSLVYFFKVFGSFLNEPETKTTLQKNIVTLKKIKQ